MMLVVLIMDPFILSYQMGTYLGWCFQREEIVLMLQKDAAAKAIVFSQFTSFLDLITFSLQKVYFLRT